MQKIFTVDPIDVLKISMQSEKEMREFYTNAASLATDDDARSIMSGLADHADVHRLNSINMYTKFSGKKILFLNLDKRYKLMTLKRCGDELYDAIRIAKRNEKELSGFYSLVARRFIEPDLRIFFRKLATDHHQHLTLLEASFEEPFEDEEETSDESILDQITHENQ
jgi:rubrerythrin